MNNTVSVDEAISKGHRLINYPTIVIMLGTIALTIYSGVQKLIPVWGFAVGFVLAFVLAWLWWSFMITRWRIWAFEHVRNVHELKKRAIQEKLIWPDNSIFVKTEIRTAADKRRLAALQYKFEQEDLFEDDLTIPSETIIYYSKGGNYVEMIFMLGLSALGLYLLIKSDNYILGSILALLGAYLSYNEYKQATNTEPQIIINEQGIKTITTDFYPWSEISNEEVISQGSGKNTHYYLTYIHSDGAEHLQIDDYETNQRSLNKLLIIYRGRSKKQANYR